MSEQQEGGEGGGGGGGGGRLSAGEALTSVSRTKDLI